MQSHLNTISSCKQYFFLNCSEKAKLLKKKSISKECIPIIVYYHHLTDKKKIVHMSIQCDEITSLIRNLNQNKANLNANDLITENQSGFRPSDSTSNQLLYLFNEIHKAFLDSKCLEVRSVFLDI